MAMTLSDKHKKLSSIIERTLIPIIDNDYIWIDLPYHANIGDSLIWEGEKRLLSKVRFQCLYSCSCNTFEYRPLSKDVIILLHGGGNFGDVWQGEQAFRLKIIQMYPNNRIIQLPQTVYYNDLQQAVRDSEIMASHKQLVICARDEYSFMFLKRFRFSKNIYLLPDLAFCIDYEDLKPMCLPENGETLFVKRIDKELSAVGKEIMIPAIEHDWPTFEVEDPMVLLLQEQITNCKSGDFSGIHKFANEEFLPHMIQEGVAFVSQYTKIYTTRLHVAILSVLLRKPVTIIDNSYGKNSQFFNTWLKDADNIKCINSNSKPITYGQVLYYRICNLVDKIRIRLAVGQRLRKILS